MDLVIYLGFDGRCEEAFRHYEKVLRGKLLMLVRNGDGPPGTPIPPGTEKHVMHARLEVPGGRLLMGGDAPVSHFSKPQGFCANVMVEDVAEAERIFRELGAGGKVTMPMADTFWARRFGMLVDRFDVPWMINVEKDPRAAETPADPFVISRTFEAPRETVWAAFTDPARMKDWWGPKGVTVTRSAMDLRPGGRYHYGMKWPDGTEMFGRMVYREIVAPERIVLVNAFADAEGGIARHPLAPVWPIEMLTTLAFAAPAKDRTTFTVTWTPLYPTADERAAFDGGHASMKNGWTGTLDKLAEYLAKR